MNKRTEVDVIEIKNASEKEKAAFLLAAKEFEEEINNKEFWYEVSIHFSSWKYKDGIEFEDFKKLILSGRDKFELEDDYSIRISTTFYYSRKRVVGYTYPGTWLTWINRNVFKGFDIADIAGNQFHEGLHNVGFGHPGANKQSLVYQCGYLLRDRIKRRLKLKPETKVKIRRTFFTRLTRFFKSIF